MAEDISSYITHPDQVSTGMLLGNWRQGIVRVISVSKHPCACISLKEKNCPCKNDALNAEEVWSINYEYIGRICISGELKIFQNSDPIIWDGDYHFWQAPAGTHFWDLLDEETAA